MLAKPHIGLVLVRAEWSERQELQSLLETLRQDALKIADRLRRSFNVQGPWVVDCDQALVTCQQALRDVDLDLVVLTFQTWGADDTRLMALVQSIGNCPLVVWCYQPWRRVPRPANIEDVLRGSGPVGTFAALGTLRNLGVPFLFTYGAPDDPRLLKDLAVAGRAAQVVRALRSARIGFLPSRSERTQRNKNSEQIMDEARLREDFGPVVQFLTVNEYRKMIDALSKEQVSVYLEQLRSRFDIEEVSEATLERAAQAALGLAQLAMNHRLDVLAINSTSLEVQRELGMRPGLYPDLSDTLPVLFQPEGDLAAATANFILHHLARTPTLFLEIWFWDEAKNRVIGGHSGVQNPILAEPGQAWVSPDYEYRVSNQTEGAQLQMIAKTGRVTLFQLRSSSRGWQAVAVSGMCLEGQSWVRGYPHAVLRLDAPISTFLDRLSEVGASQHWIMAYGSVIAEIEALCSMMSIPLEVITSS